MAEYAEVSQPILYSPFEKPSRYWYIQEGSIRSYGTAGARRSSSRLAIRKKSGPRRLRSGGRKNIRQVTRWRW